MDRVQRDEAIAAAKYRVSILEMVASGNQGVQLSHCVRRQSDRQAQLAHAAGGAVRLETADRDDVGSRIRCWRKG